MKKSKLSFKKIVSASAKFILNFFVAFFFVSAFIVLIFKWINPPTTSIMIQRKISALIEGNERQVILNEWVGYNSISKYMALAVVASEDQNFPNHFGFDVEQIESRILESLSLLVDTTKVDLAEFAEQATLFGEWHTGEVTGPGTLVCSACGEELHFHKTGHIPPCPKCTETKYHRRKD